MYEVSSIKSLSINPCKSAQLLRKYQKHVKTIVQIANKKTNIKQSAEQQQKISELLRKARLTSRHFQQKQFERKVKQENNRLMKSISHIKSRERLATQSSANRENKKHCPSLRQLQIIRQNKALMNNIQENTLDGNKYKKKMQKQIQEYLKVRRHMQKLKPLPQSRVTYNILAK